MAAVTNNGNAYTIIPMLALMRQSNLPQDNFLKESSTIACVIQVLSRRTHGENQIPPALELPGNQFRLHAQMCGPNATDSGCSPDSFDKLEALSIQYYGA